MKIKPRTNVEIFTTRLSGITLMSKLFARYSYDLTRNPGIFHS